MRYLINIVLICTLFGCKNPTTDFLISGKVQGINETKVTLTSNDFANEYAHAVVKNNQFILKGTVPVEGFYQVDFSGIYTTPQRYGFTTWRHGCLIYIQKGANYVFTANSDLDILYNKYKIVTNSTQHLKYMEFEHEFDLQYKKKLQEKSILEKQIDLALKQGKFSIYNALNDSLIKLLKETDGLTQKIMHSYVIKNKDAVYTPFLIMKAGDMNTNYKLYQTALNNLDLSLKNNLYTIAANKNIKRAEKIMEEQTTFPAVTAYDIHHNAFDLRKYKDNKLIVISFWASWCNPCIKEIKYIKANSSMFSKKHIEFVFLSVDQKETGWQQLSRELELNNNYLLIDKERQKLIEKFNIVSIPRNIIINLSGKVISINAFTADDPEFMEQIDRYLKIKD